MYIMIVSRIVPKFNFFNGIFELILSQNFMPPRHPILWQFHNKIGKFLYGKSVW